MKFHFNNIYWYNYWFGPPIFWLGSIWYPSFWKIQFGLWVF